jgi:hypothetical protein
MGMSYQALIPIVPDPLHAEDGGGYWQVNGHNYGPHLGSLLASLVVVASTTGDILLDGVIGG